MSSTQKNTSQGERQAGAGTNGASGAGDPVFEIGTPGGYIGEHLFEMIVVPPNGKMGWQTRFACRRMPDGDVQVVPHVDIDGVRYRPLPPTKGTKVLLQY